MSQTVGDFLVHRLQQWGVRHIFGYPGDGINGVFGALNRANGGISFVQARHEEMAAFMAAAYAILRAPQRLYRDIRTGCFAFDDGS
jgi:pyruvate dehydrogenase (quinone)